jgi:hypothetical protein
MTPRHSEQYAALADPYGLARAALRRSFSALAGAYFPAPVFVSAVTRLPEIIHDCDAFVKVVRHHFAIASFLHPHHHAPLGIFLAGFRFPQEQRGNDGDERQHRPRQEEAMNDIDGNFNGFLGEDLLLHVDV